MCQAKWKKLSAWSGQPNSLRVLPGLGNPEDFEALAEYLDETYRPGITAGGLDIYVDADNGDDDSYDGSQATASGENGPFKTVERAFQLVGINNKALTTIHLAGATTEKYSLPEIVSQLNNVTIKGDTPTTESTRGIDDDYSGPTDADGLRLSVAGTESANTMIGMFVEVVDGDASGARGWVYDNAAASGGYVDINATLDQQDDWTWGGNETSIKELKHSSIIDLGSVVRFTNCVNLKFEDIEFTGSGKLIRLVNTDKVEFKWCKIATKGLRVGRYGGAFVTSSLVACVGESGDGMVSAVNGGELQIQNGTVVSAVNAPTHAFVNLDSGARMRHQGEVVFEGLGASGILADSATWVPARAPQLAHDILRFIDCSASVSINSQDNGVGGEYAFPNVHGDSIGTFTAASGAFVQLGANSSTVSVDAAGTGDAQASDGTLITGGSPSENGWLTADEKDALAGASTGGTPGASNKFVTDDDTRLTVFGTELVSAESGSAGSDDSGSWATHLSTTSTSFPAGTYLVTWFMRVASDTGGQSCDFKITAGGSDVRSYSSTLTVYVEKSGQKLVSLSAASHTFEIQFKSPSTEVSALIEAGAQIMAWRVA